ncbi:SDR family NAD(P)-dependent oxidoreductase [Hominifimenecus sp. rT4P-3]|uniref:SDR family NAD(P)-dependent oxidoreductase n=1 Tax=Hominifimenecus sp. rT4P-3 TaxID=3242979 RepID=UPI003DA30834
MRMADKTAVLVKGVSELGQAAAEELLKEGAAAVILVDEEKKAGLAEALTGKYPQRVFFVAADTGDILEMEKAARQIEDTFGKMDALINLQDEQSTGGCMEISEEEWSRVLKANLSELYYSAHSFLPGMKKRRGGRVVILTSMAGRCAGDYDIAYGAAKTGAMGFTRGLAMEVREYGITVNSIAAGDLRDASVKNAVVHAILYLASDEAPWTTGDCMDVNGGAFMQN